MDDENSRDRNYRIGTVHSVKGETFEAVLLILRTRGLGPHYRTMLNQNVLTTASEELRIAYVGLTRPRKVLQLAVPDANNEAAWKNKLLPTEPNAVA
jgi:DNA helicase-2/ATP-dependent DNA helicase PcrA